MRRTGSPPVTIQRPDASGSDAQPHEDQARAQFLADFLVIHARSVAFSYLPTTGLTTDATRVEDACLILGEFRHSKRNGLSFRSRSVFTEVG